MMVPLLYRLQYTKLIPSLFPSNSTSFSPQLSSGLDIVKERPDRYRYWYQWNYTVFLSIMILIPCATFYAFMRRWVAYLRLNWLYLTLGFPNSNIVSSCVYLKFCLRVENGFGNNFTHQKRKMVSVCLLFVVF